MLTSFISSLALFLFLYLSPTTTLSLSLSLSLQPCSPILLSSVVDATSLPFSPSLSLTPAFTLQPHTPTLLSSVEDTAYLCLSSATLTITHRKHTISLSLSLSLPPSSPLSLSISLSLSVTLSLSLFFSLFSHAHRFCCGHHHSLYLSLSPSLFYVQPIVIWWIEVPFFQSSVYAMLTSTRVIIVIINLMIW